MTLKPGYLDNLRTQINANMQGVYTDGPKLLIDPLAYSIIGDGKRLRPIFTLIAAEVCGGNIEEAIHAAVAVELLHNFTLIHDDIMDGDDLRHGQSTIHKKWDVGVGILAGDAMFVVAIGKLRQSTKNVEPMTDAFVKGALAVCEGQALDKEFETSTGVTVENYLEMIDLKTGYLLGLAGELGGLVADGGSDKIQALQRYGRLVGRAFQVQDDLLEIFSSADNMGKSLGSDLLSEKKTYLLVEAWNHDPAAVRMAINSAGLNLADGLDRIRDILNESGVRKKAETFVKDTIDDAMVELEIFGEKKAVLVDFGNYILNRKK